MFNSEMKILVLLALVGILSCGQNDSAENISLSLINKNVDDSLVYPTLGDTLITPRRGQRVSSTVDFIFNPIVPKINEVYLLNGDKRVSNILSGSPGVDLYTQGFCYRFGTTGQKMIEIVSKDLFGRSISYKTSFVVDDLNGKGENCPDSVGGIIYDKVSFEIIWSSVKDSSYPSSFDNSTPYLSVPKDSCKMKKETIKLYKHGNVKFPAVGKAVREAHYVTRSDPPGYPSSTRKNIDKHLDISCGFIRSKYPVVFGRLTDDCGEIYDRVGAHSWTPSESGRIGQGSRGWVKPSIVDEIWNATMYWGSGERPVAGSKFIVINKANGRAVVSTMGFETGPASTAYIAGVSPEIDWYLKNNQRVTKLLIGRAVNQRLHLGPIVCEDE
jgi:hypothetical protein